MNAEHTPALGGGFKFRRILMALDPASEDLSTVEETAALARRLRAELLSLFVEDIDLVRLSQHPEFRAFSRLSAGPQPFAADDLRRALKRQLARSRDAVERAAAQQRIKAVFQVRQGRPVAEIVSAAGAADLVVVEWARRASPALPASSRAATVLAILEATPRPVFLLRPGTPADGPIMVVFGGSDVDRRAVHAAAEIARHDGGIIEVALPTDSPEQADAWRREIVDALAPSHLTVRFLHMPKADMEDLCATATRRGVSLMVLGADPGGARCAALPRAVERGGCSVLLVR